MSTNLKKGVPLTLPIALLSSLFLSTAAMSAIVDHGELVKGQVTITRTGEFDAVIAIDRAPADGVADLAFVYRSAMALPSDLLDFEADATVLVRPNAVLVKPRKDREIVFMVATTEGFVPTILAKKDTSLFIDSGFQISRLYGGDVRERAMSMITRSSLLKSEEESCWGGGEGATGCSLQGGAGPVGAGCSVTCGSGYYACCTPTGGCKCVEDTPEAF
jgi:hypothetical protein